MKIGSSFSLTNCQRCMSLIQDSTKMLRKRTTDELSNEKPKRCEQINKAPLKYSNDYVVVEHISCPNFLILAKIHDSQRADICEDTTTWNIARQFWYTIRIYMPCSFFPFFFLQTPCHYQPCHLGRCQPIYARNDFVCVFPGKFWKMQREHITYHTKQAQQEAVTLTAIPLYTCQGMFSKQLKLCCAILKNVIKINSTVVCKYCESQASEKQF